jgi:hypothetical protein
MRRRTMIGAISSAKSCFPLITDKWYYYIPEIEDDEYGREIFG